MALIEFGAADRKKVAKRRPRCRRCEHPYASHGGFNCWYRFQPGADTNCNCLGYKPRKRAKPLPPSLTKKLTRLDVLIDAHTRALVAEATKVRKLTLQRARMMAKLAACDAQRGDDAGGPVRRFKLKGEK